MAGFDDILKRWQPAAALAVCDSVTQGRTWRYELLNVLRDDDGVLIPLVGAEYAVTMQVVDQAGAVTATFAIEKDTLGPSSIVATVRDPQSAAVPGTREGKPYGWRAHIVRTTTVDGIQTTASVQLWGGVRSVLTVIAP